MAQIRRQTTGLPTVQPRSNVGLRRAQRSVPQYQDPTRASRPDFSAPQLFNPNVLLSFQDRARKVKEDDLAQRKAQAELAFAKAGSDGEVSREEVGGLVAETGNDAYAQLGGKALTTHSINRYNELRAEAPVEEWNSLLGQAFNEIHGEGGIGNEFADGEHARLWNRYAEEQRQEIQIALLKKQREQSFKAINEAASGIVASGDFSIENFNGYVLDIQLSLPSLTDGEAKALAFTNLADFASQTPNSISGLLGMMRADGFDKSHPKQFQTIDKKLWDDLSKSKTMGGQEIYTGFKNELSGMLDENGRPTQDALLKWQEFGTNMIPNINNFAGLTYEQRLDVQSEFAEVGRALGTYTQNMEFLLQGTLGGSGGVYGMRIEDIHQVLPEALAKAQSPEEMSLMVKTIWDAHGIEAFDDVSLERIFAALGGQDLAITDSTVRALLSADGSGEIYFSLTEDRPELRVLGGLVMSGFDITNIDAEATAVAYKAMENGGFAKMLADQRWGGYAATESDEEAVAGAVKDFFVRVSDKMHSRWRNRNEMNPELQDIAFKLGQAVAAHLYNINGGRADSDLVADIVAKALKPTVRYNGKGLVVRKDYSSSSTRPPLTESFNGENIVRNVDKSIEEVKQVFGLKSDITNLTTAYDENGEPVVVAELQDEVGGILTLELGGEYTLPIQDQPTGRGAPQRLKRETIKLGNTPEEIEKQISGRLSDDAKDSVVVIPIYDAFGNVRAVKLGVVPHLRGQSKQSMEQREAAKQKQLDNRQPAGTNQDPAGVEETNAPPPDREMVRKLMQKLTEKGKVFSTFFLQNDDDDKPLTSEALMEAFKHWNGSEDNTAMWEQVEKRWWEVIQAEEGVHYVAYDDYKGNRTTGVGFNLDSPEIRGLFREFFDLDEVEFAEYYHDSKALSKSEIKAFAFHLATKEFLPQIENKLSNVDGVDLYTHLNASEVAGLLSLVWQCPKCLGDNMVAAIYEWKINGNPTDFLRDFTENTTKNHPTRRRKEAKVMFGEDQNIDKIYASGKWNEEEAIKWGQAHKDIFDAYSNTR